MTDMFTGMPFYWQGGGGGGLGGLGGNAATGQPAMSSSQINASMGWNPYASFNPFANTPGGFGGQTDYYSNLGAAFGRQTGGFNASPGYPSGNVQRGADLPAPDTSGRRSLPGSRGGTRPHTAHRSARISSSARSFDLHRQGERRRAIPDQQPPAEFDRGKWLSCR